MQSICMDAKAPFPSSAQFKRDLGVRLRAAIEATHPASLSSWCRSYGVPDSKLGNWLRGDSYPPPDLLARYCADTGLTMDFLYRGVLAGVAFGVAAALMEPPSASCLGLTGCSNSAK